jgi:hypothetical protein
MMKVATLTDRSTGQRLASSFAIASIACMALSTPIKSSSRASAGQLTREQIDALVNKLRDPSLARKFLMDAGLIDAAGQLSGPYRSQDAQTA